MVDQRPDEAEEDEEDQHNDPNHRELVGQELAGASRQPLEMNWTSPPSGPSGPLVDTPTSEPSPSMSGWSGSGKTDAWIGHGNCDVCDQVAKHGQDAAEHDVGEHDVVVEVVERL